MCSFQSPVEVPGVSNSDFLRLAANARRKQLGQEELGPLEFYGYVMPKVGQHCNMLRDSRRLSSQMQLYILPSSGFLPSSHFLKPPQSTCSQRQVMCVGHERM